MTLLLLLRRPVATADAAGSLPLIGSASGSVLVQGDGSGTLSLIGGEIGGVLVQGDEAGTMTLLGVSSAVALVQAAADMLLVLSGVGAGVVAVQAESANVATLLGSGAGGVAAAGNHSGVLVLLGASDGSIADAAAAPETVHGPGGRARRVAGPGRYYNPAAARSSRPFRGPALAPAIADHDGLLVLVGQSHGVVSVRAETASHLALVGASSGAVDDPFFRAVALLLLDEAA